MLDRDEEIDQKTVKELSATTLSKNCHIDKRIISKAPYSPLDFSIGENNGRSVLDKSIICVKKFLENIDNIKKLLNIKKVFS